MRCLLVILSAWTCLGVSVGLRVPSAWDEAQGRDSVRYFNDGSSTNHRFSNLNDPQRHNSGRLERRVYIENEQANANLGTLYNTLQSSALNDFFRQPQQMLVVSHNGLYMVPQNSQENAAISSETTQYRTELPPLRNTRYPENFPLQYNTNNNNNFVQYQRPLDISPNVPVMIGGHQYQAPQNVLLPSNVVRIAPVSPGNINFNNYKVMEPALKHPVMRQISQKYRPLIHKEYAQTPSRSHGTQIEVPVQSLQNHVSRDDTFIVSASTLSPIESDPYEDNSAVEHTTKKEPIFFVTEGYTNVLVQGSNKKKKKYQKPHYQNQEASKKVVKTEKLEEDVEEEDDYEDDEILPRKRKVTKIYKIHGNNQGRGDNAGSKRNLVEEDLEKPRRYFKRPEVSTEDERRAGVRNYLINNHRDDKLHEPSDDHDSEREDEDAEKIKDDEIESESEEESETDAEEDSDDENNPKSETKETDKAESDDDEESDEEEDTEDEEENEPEREVPHSEHADPKPVPTKPIYPGAGAWAKPGMKHRPYVTQHRFLKPQEVEQRPDGYDVFEDLEKYFDSQKDQFGRTFGQKTSQPNTAVPNTPIANEIISIKQPNPVNPLIVYDPFNESSERSSQQVPNSYPVPINHRIHGGENKNIQQEQNAEEDLESNEENDLENDAAKENDDEEEEQSNDKQPFVPIQLYTQVRKSENEEHEPHDPLEHGRLREVIKDSKVQTVYSEEGYEDAAYDHAGHEKKAEQDQGHEQFEREKVNKAKQKKDDSDAGHSKKVLVTDVPVEDSLPADSIYPSLPNIVESEETTIIPKMPNPPTNNKNFITTQEVKTTQVKDKKNGDVQLEIQSEVKVIVQPNNSTKAHKYVKIYPKVLREFPKKSPEDDEPKNDNNSTKAELEQNLGPSITTTEISENNADEITKIRNKPSVTDITSDNPIADSTIADLPLATKVRIKAFKDEFINVSSSEKPKVTVKVFDDEEALTKITDEFGKIGSEVKRKKRSADSENKDLEIDIGFIDKINHTFAEKVPDEVDVEKYPYYVMPDLNENSPLRYAENMDNIPVKKSGELSFYKMADKLECPELPQSIDPIPEYVKNADKDAEESEDDEYDDEDEDKEDDEEGDEEEHDDESVVDQEHPPTPKTPRIQLGDKIDCLKIRYFGENPLDSPFFKEETVGPVKSIFKELDRKSNKIQNNRNIDNAQKTSHLVENVSKVNEIFNQKDKQNERKFATEIKDKVYNALKETTEKLNHTNAKTKTLSSIESENDKAESINTNIKVNKPILSNIERRNDNPTPAPLVTLITTPKYTIQLTPKNIYDQIKLLDHLPEDEDVTEKIETSTKSITQTLDNQKKNIKAHISTEAVQPVILRRADQADNSRESRGREPKVLREETINKEEHEQDSPDSEALRRRRLRLRPRKPVYQIFDVNKFLTTTPYSIINPAPSTVLPKHKVISEVFYKDEIKPNEQLNVFADILNNIKNSSKLEAVPLQSASNFAEPDSVTISILEDTNFGPASPKIRVKKFQRDSSDNNNFIDRNPIPNSVTTEKHFNARYPDSYEEHHRTPYTSTHKNIVNLGFTKPDNFGYVDHNTRSTQKNFYSGEDVTQYTSHPSNNVGTKKTLRRRRKPTKSTLGTTSSTTFRTTTNIYVPSQSTPGNHKPYVIDVFEDTKEVVGLVPPSKGLYKTIVEDSDEGGTDEVPQQVYEYKTIPPNYATEPLTGPAAVTELIDEDTPSMRPMNKYYFLGLKPPSNQRARSYDEFIINTNVVNGNNKNNVRRRIANGGYGHLRFKREAARATYSEVSRNRGRQNEGIRETTPYDEIDDYVPHRPKNYYYDEKTGKIVYQNKHKEEKEEEEEEEYEEIPDTPGIYLETAEDATHPSPKKVTTKPLLATATPPPAGKGLLDFVAKLKNNPAYQVILDPTTPDPSNETSTKETVTVDPKTTDPPEFLSILSRVKSDSSYKVIGDPKEIKSKAKSTTPEPEYDNEEEEDEEEEGTPPKRRRFTRQTDLQIFNIGDFLPKIQTPISSPVPKTPTNFFKTQIVERIFPKLRYMTPLDIAKESIRERFQNNTIYQFIQKNIQNSPGGQSQTQDLANIEIFDIGEYLPKIKTVSPKTSIDYSKYKTIERPHTRHNMSSRYNSEEQPNLDEVVTVRKPIIMEERESIDRPVVSEERIAHDKEVKVATEEVMFSTTQRIVQSRRGTRPTTQKKTAETTEPTESLVTRRTANRRRPAPSGFRTTKRPTTTEVTEATEKIERVYPQYSPTEKTYSQTHEPSKRVYRRRPVRIRYTTERQEEEDEAVDKIVRRSLDDVQDEFEEEFIEEPNVPKTYEDIKREIVSGDKKEKELVSGEDNEKSLVEYNSEEDKNNNDDKQLDDNVQEKEASASRKKEILEEPQKLVERTKQNYDGRKELDENLNQNHNLGLNLNNVPKKELKTKIEKANVKLEDINSEQHKVEDSQKQATQNNVKKVDIINPKYDKTKKQGGNYKKENEDEDTEEGLTDNGQNGELFLNANDKLSDVEIIDQHYDKTKKHGGNYKPIEDASNEELLKSAKDVETQHTESTDIVRSKKAEIIDDNDYNSNTNTTREVEESHQNYNGPNQKRWKKVRPKTKTSSSLSNTKTIPRLTDIAPKPDHFYTDSQLPKDVNKLTKEKTNIKLDSKELEQVTEEGDVIDLKEISDRRSYNTKTGERSEELFGSEEELSDNQSYDTDLLDDSVNEGVEMVAPQDKPVFIKDPSKRLYFYAPV